MPLIVLLILAFSSTGVMANCTTVKETCLQGPETRTIGGVDVFRECWQWETVTECEAGGTVNHCAPLESNGACVETDNECLTSSKPGECELRQKEFSCTNPWTRYPRVLRRCQKKLTSLISLKQTSIVLPPPMPPALRLR